MKKRELKILGIRLLFFSFVQLNYTNIKKNERNFKNTTK